MNLTLENIKKDMKLYHEGIALLPRARQAIENATGIKASSMQSAVLDTLSCLSLDKITKQDIEILDGAIIEAFIYHKLM